MPDDPVRAFGGDMQNFDMSNCLRPEVFALSVLLSSWALPIQLTGMTGRFGAASLSGRIGLVLPPGSTPEGESVVFGAGGSRKRRRNRRVLTSSILRGLSSNLRDGQPQNPPAAWISGRRQVAGIRPLRSGTD